MPKKDTKKPGPGIYPTVIKTGLVVVVALMAMACMIFVLPDMSGPEQGAPDRYSVAATIFPLYDIVRNVSGQAVDVILILPVGAEPHGFEPAPSVIRSLKDVGAVYSIGHGVDDWVDNIVTAAACDKIVVDRGVTLRRAADGMEEDAGHDESGSDHQTGIEDEDEGVGHRHDGEDPHYWLAVANAKIIASNVAADLTARFPDKAVEITRNLHGYIYRLDTADSEIRRLLTMADKKDIITFHDAWYYFAEAYGLRIAGTFEPAAAKEPTPRYLAELETAARQYGVSVIYAEPLFSSDKLESFADGIGLTISTLDPIGGGTDTPGYIETMIKNAATISENQ